MKKFENHKRIIQEYVAPDLEVYVCTYKRVKSCSHKCSHVGGRINSRKSFKAVIQHKFNCLSSAEQDGHFHIQILR